MSPAVETGSEPNAHALRKTECIVNAARTVFVETGYGAATVDGIAAAAGVSKATIYTRFASKQALFAAVVERECAACSKRMALVEEAPDPGLSQALRDIADTLLDIILLPRNLSLLRLVIAELPRFPELGRTFYDSGPAVTLKNLTGFIERRIARGELRARDAAVAAQHFISLLRGDIQWRVLMGGVEISQTTRREAVDRSLEAFLQLYGAPPAGRPVA
ncbi:MAG TPA: TetR/AcrR family transcriptional regulator [Nevskiaceae bacterium]|nr:TetR/AcrR family transcriptional regulator [Nevskiaceae bacterium]